MSLKSSRAQFLSLVAVVWFCCFVGAAPVRAATFTVNSTIDAPDVRPGNGSCETAPGNGVCTLRAAVQEANASLGADTITLPAGIYVLTIPADVEPDAASGDLNIVEDLAITGGGAGSTIVDGNGSESIFEIDAPGGLTVLLSGVTITGGRGGANGGGIEAARARSRLPMPSWSATALDGAAASLPVPSQLSRSSGAPWPATQPTTVAAHTARERKP